MENVKKFELLYLAGANVKLIWCCEKQYENSLKNWKGLPYDPEIPLVGI